MYLVLTFCTLILLYFMPMLSKLFTLLFSHIKVAYSVLSLKKKGKKQKTKTKTKTTKMITKKIY